jgi:hypothetical protein
MPRSIISFGFEDGFEEGTTFKGLSNITGVVRKDFFLEAGTEAGTEVEPGIATGVFGTVGIAGILEIAGTVIGAVENRGCQWRRLGSFVFLCQAR